MSEPTAVRFSLCQSYLLRCFPGVSPKSIPRKHAAHEPQCTPILRGSCDFPSFYMSLTTVARVGILFFPRGVSSAVLNSLPKIVQAVLDRNVTEECGEGQKSASLRGMNENWKTRIKQLYLVVNLVSPLSRKTLRPFKISTPSRHNLTLFCSEKKFKSPYKTLKSHNEN